MMKFEPNSLHVDGTSIIVPDQALYSCPLTPLRVTSDTQTPSILRNLFRSAFPPTSPGNYYQTSLQFLDIEYLDNILQQRVEDRAAASRTTRVGLLKYYSSNFLLLEYSLISISGCKFPFPVAVFLQSIDECWNLCKLAASRFHFQHASLEIRG